MIDSGDRMFHAYTPFLVFFLFSFASWISLAWALELLWAFVHRMRNFFVVTLVVRMLATLEESECSLSHETLITNYNFQLSGTMLVR